MDWVTYDFRLAESLSLYHPKTLMESIDLKKTMKERHLVRKHDLQCISNQNQDKWIRHSQNRKNGSINAI